MRIVHWSLGLICCLILALPLTASANNTTSGTAHSIMIGGPATLDSLSDARPEAWYRTTVVAGRSYCVQTYSHPFFDTGDEPDTIVTVFQNDGVTLIVPTSGVSSNDDTPGEPRGRRLSRACFIAGTSENIRTQITRFVGGVSFNFRFQIVETTLWCPWYFIGGDFNSFSLLRNTTNGAINVVVTWYTGAGGLIVLTAPTAVGSNAAFTPNARLFVDPVVNFNGSVEVAHTGSPGAVMGIQTSLSGTTGTSFDVPCTSRPTQ